MFNVYHYLVPKKQEELKELYLTSTIRTFALSIVSVFVPIYLYTLGYSLLYILVFYFLAKLFQALGEYPVGRLIGRYGAKHVIALSLPMTALNFFLFMTLGSFHWPIWLLAIFTAIPLNLYWPAYHHDFSQAKDKKHVGKQIGKNSILASIFGALGPVLGGIIAQNYGLPVAIFVTIILLFIAAFPLFGSLEMTEKVKPDMKQFKFKDNFRDMVAYAGYGLEVSSLNVIWPLFLYILISDYFKVGSIATISLIVMIISSIIIARITDRYEKQKVMKTASLVNFFTSGSRILVSTAGIAYVVGVVAAIGHIFLYIPFVSEYYLHADRPSRLEYIIGMETAVDLGTCLSFVILIFSSFFLEIKTVLMIGIILGAIGALFSLNIARSQTITLTDNIARGSNVKIY